MPSDFWPETVCYFFRGKKQKHYFVLGKKALLNGELITFPVKHSALRSRRGLVMPSQVRNVGWLCV